MLLLPPFRASFKPLLTYKHDGDEKRRKVDEQFIVALKLGTRLLNNKLLKSITLCSTLTVFVFSPFSVKVSNISTRIICWKSMHRMWRSFSTKARDSTKPQSVSRKLIKASSLNEINFTWFSSLFFCHPLGDYLGEKKPFNEQVLKAFVELHDFTNLILVQALR